MDKKHLLKMWLWLLAALGVVALAGCGQRDAAGPVERRLTVIGIDAADWIPADSLLAEGRLPHLRALLAQGTAVDMLSLVPLEKSPLLWASIATGLRPAQHRVAGFVEDDGVTPRRGSAWPVPAIWDVAAAAGLRTTVIGWWVTHPARPVAGVMVSDYLPYAANRQVPLAGLVEPAALGPELAALRVDPGAITLEELGRFVNLPALAGREEQYAKELRELRAIWAADRSYLAVGRHLAQTRPADGDLFLLYLRGLDMVCHQYWRYWQPDKSSLEVSAEERAIFGGVVKRYYEFADEMIGEALSWFPPDRPVVVLSDHGFYGSRHRKRGWTLGTEEHRREGVFVVRAPAYAAGARGGNLELLDVAPTLLSLLGLPASREMPGRIMTAGLTRAGRSAAERLEKGRVESYQALRPAPGDSNRAGDPAVDEAIRQQLRSLGYIQ